MLRRVAVGTLAMALVIGLVWLLFAALATRNRDAGIVGYMSVGNEELGAIDNIVVVISYGFNLN